MNFVSEASKYIIPVFILWAVLYAFRARVRVYDSFVGGAREGLETIARIFPYVLAIFVAIKTFQASGAYDMLRTVLAPAAGLLGVPPEVLSLSALKPLSGTASLGVLTDIIKTLGPDSRAAIIGAVIIGSAETTFYVLAVYLGAAGVKKTRYLVPVCLLADVAGILIAIGAARMLF